MNNFNQKNQNFQNFQIKISKSRFDFDLNDQFNFDEKSNRKLSRKSSRKSNRDQIFDSKFWRYSIFDLIFDSKFWRYSISIQCLDSTRKLDSKSRTRLDAVSLRILLSKTCCFFLLSEFRNLFLFRMIANSLIRKCFDVMSSLFVKFIFLNQVSCHSNSCMRRRFSRKLFVEILIWYNINENEFLE